MADQNDAVKDLLAAFVLTDDEGSDLKMMTLFNLVADATLRNRYCKTFYRWADAIARADGEITVAELAWLDM